MKAENRLGGTGRSIVYREFCSYCEKKDCVILSFIMTERIKIYDIFDKCFSLCNSKLY